MKCILLCAGYATRLFPLTENFPKALLEIEEGKPLLDYILDEVNTIDQVDTIYVITNDRYYNHFNEWASKKNNIKPIEVISDHTKSNEDRLGAVGDINYTIKYSNIEDDLLIIAGDSLFDFKLNDMVSFFNEVNNSVIGCKTNDNYEMLKSLAVVKLDENNKIINFTEKPSKPESNIAAYALYIFPKEILFYINQYLEEGNKPDMAGYLPEYLYKKVPVYGYILPGDFYDVGTHESLKEVREMYKNK